MARNVISERVLGMPREQALDRSIPFRDVPRGASRKALSRGRPYPAVPLGAGQQRLSR
jgi:hypothetical protein